MGKKSLVTIAIASYNNSKYIERCIDSVIHQSYDHVEILIIDDGSNDDTLNRVEKYKEDHRIRIVLKENGGLSSVRQKAFEEAKGDYICFIDADDYLKEDYVSGMLLQITDDNSDICICSTQVENEEGIVNERDTQAFKVADGKPLKVTTELLAEKHCNLSGKLSLSDSWNKMYNTSFLRRTGVQFRLPKGYNGTDLVFNHKVVLYEPQYSFVSSVGYCHVLYKKSAVRRKKKELQKGFQYIISDIIGEARRVGNYEQLKGKMSNLHYYLLRYALQDRLNETEGLMEKLKEVRNSRESNSDFIRNECHIDNSIAYMETKSLKGFYILFRFLPFFLPLFFKLRKSLTE